MKKKNLLITGLAILGFATIAMTQVPSYVPTNGLLGWWPFNGNANDASGNGNNGTVNGATLTTDRFGITNSAFSFDGVDDFISSPSQSNLNNFSISLWTKLSAEGFVYYLVSQDNDGGSGHFSLNYDCQLGTFYGGLGIGQLNNVNASAFNPVPHAFWHHIVLTFDGFQLQIYVDGVLSGTQLNSSTIYDSGQPLLFGRHLLPSFPYFTKGIIDDIGLWNQALTQQEITNLYNGCQLLVNVQPSNQTVNINNPAQFVVSSSDPNATFQWQSDLGIGFQNLNNVGQYSGATNDTLTVSNVTMSNNNQPFRCIINSGSCSDTSNVAVLTVNNNVGINEFTQDNLFSVFPNPAKSQINVKADAKLLGSIYTVYDNTGKVVLSGKIISENTTIELGNLSGGIYLFSVGENLKQTFKVIKE